MKTFHEEIPDLCQDALTDQLFDEHSIFFDIETTGFSPANSTLYMIGCARRKSNRICIDQFFAEKPEEEAEIPVLPSEIILPSKCQVWLCVSYVCAVIVRDLTITVQIRNDIFSVLDTRTFQHEELSYGTAFLYYVRSYAGSTTDPWIACINTVCRIKIA